MAEESEETALLKYYESRCRAACSRQSSLVFTIPLGANADVIGVTLELTTLAMTNSKTAVFSEKLDNMFAESPLVLMPLASSYSKAEEMVMSTMERIQRLGYARDRVLACNAVKKAMLSVGKVGANQQFVSKQNEKPRFFQEWFKKFELGLFLTQTVARPSKTNENKREQWRRLVDVDPDSMQNQPTFLQATALTGTTRRQMEALAQDPALEKEETFAVSHVEIENQSEYDYMIGTETFVSFSFPPAEHDLLVAAAAVDGGISREDGSISYPALVTMHGQDGQASCLAVSASMCGVSPNTLFVGDAAALLVKLHSLSANAPREFLLLEHQ